ncbi:ABC transporter permease subunit [Paenibacillus sp. CCS19]|uniref:ABC transporter permease n=1 Tax=Paenibacillus sp. CCS19 TaxID=3158387 RepID=UPI00295E5078|nr:ABC transporter permease subunit [Paenibacillus cellulosilyticus]
MKVKGEETLQQVAEITEGVKPKAEGKKHGLKEKFRYIKSNYWLYLLVLPSVVLTVIFKYFPMYGVLIAFKDYNYRKGILGSDWVGFHHFERFLNAPNFEQLFFNTLKLNFYGLLLGFPVPIILAIMLNQVRKAVMKKNIQLFLYAPNFISVVVVVGMLFVLLSPTGPINKIVTLFGGAPISFTSDPDYFRPLYILSGIWQGAGWASIIYVAALANVDPELHNAATLDGASLLQRIRHIDIPTIKPVIAIMIILAAGGIMGGGGDKAILMWNELNMEASDIISTYVYRVGFQQANYSFSAAVELFNTVINLIMLITVNWIVKRVNEGNGIV